MLVEGEEEERNAKVICADCYMAGVPAILCGSACAEQLMLWAVPADMSVADKPSGRSSCSAL